MLRPGGMLQTLRSLNPIKLLEALFSVAQHERLGDEKKENCGIPYPATNDTIWVT
jgi:hypothetical protein